MSSATIGKAAVISAFNEPFEIRELEVPEPEPGAIVVKVDVATVCGSDVHAWDGSLSRVQHVDHPLILGHEAVGTVVKIGAGAEVDSVGQALVPGDRVVWTHESCGRCYTCTVERQPALCPNRRFGMFSDPGQFPHFTGTFGEYSYVWPRSGRLRVPDDIPSDWASAASCALRTIINAIERVGIIDGRHSVVVQGTGPLGLFATAMLSTHQPKRLIAIGGPEDRLALAADWGAEELVSIEDYPTPEARIERVIELTDGGANVVFDMSGAGSAVHEGIQMCALAGRFGVVGTVGGEAQPILAHPITHRGLTLFGSFGGDIDSYYKAIEFMRGHRDRFDWNRMLTGRYDLTDINVCMERMKDFTEIKPVIVPGGVR